MIGFSPFPYCIPNGITAQKETLTCQNIANGGVLQVEATPQAEDITTGKGVNRRRYPLPVENLLYAGPATSRKLCTVGACMICRLAEHPVDALVWQQVRFYLFLLR